MAKIGIDFGTVNSSVVWKKDGEIRTLLRNDNDAEVLFAPSIVQYKNGVVKSGWQIPTTETLINSANSHTIKNLKALLGNDQYDEEVFGKDKWELAKLYLTYLLTTAVSHPDFSGQNITEVVLSKPISFSTIYAIRLKECIESIEAEAENGKIKGITVSGIVDEPVAIALNAINDGETVLTYDMGGGTFDAALVKKTGDHYQVMATGGNKHAGNYMDRMLGELCVQKLHDERVTLDDLVSDHGVAKNLNLTSLREAKEMLETGENRYLIKLLHPKVGPCEVEITVEEYRNQIRPCIDETIVICEDLIAKCRTTGNVVSRIILAGGGSKSAYLQECLRERYSNVFNLGVDKRIATAAGNVKYEGKNVGNILNYSFGILLKDQKLDCYFIRNLFFKHQSIPTDSVSLSLQTLYGGSKITIQLYLGEETDESHVTEYDLRKQRRLTDRALCYQYEGSVIQYGHRFTFSYYFDADGILHTTVTDQYGEREQNIGDLLKNNF